MLRIPLALFLFLGALFTGNYPGLAGVGLLAFLFPVAMLVFTIFIYLYAGFLFP